MAVPKRDAKYQATLMVAAFGAEKAYKFASDSMTNSTAKLADWWVDVRRHINYVPPPKERTPEEERYFRMVAWATAKGVAFTQNKWASSITIHSNQPMFE